VIDSRRQYWEAQSVNHRDFAYQYGKNPDQRYPQYEIRRDRLIELLDPHDRGRLLDAGCGTGNVLAACLQNGWDGYGVDFAEGMIEGARALLSEAGENPDRVSHSHIWDLSQFESGSFAAVVIMGVLSYVTDEEERRFLAEAARILQPGGVLVTHNINTLFDMFTLNRFTVDFYDRQFLSLFFDDAAERADARSRIAALLAHPEAPAPGSRMAPTRDQAPSRQANPLTFGSHVEHFGFAQKDQVYLRFHAVPPLLFEQRPADEALPVEHETALCRDWRGMFLASNFMTVFAKTETAKTV